MNTFICMYKKRGILGAWYLGELSNSSKEMQNTASARVPGVVSYEFHGWLFSLKHLCLYKKSSRPTVWNITFKYQCMTCNHCNSAKPKHLSKQQTMFNVDKATSISFLTNSFRITLAVLL